MSNIISLIAVAGAGVPPTPTLSVSASNVSVALEGPSPTGRVPATSGAATITTPLNGTGPYTFLWEKQTDADGDAFIISGVTDQNATWYGDPRLDSHVDNTETWRVTVTDNVLDTASDTISVTLQWTNNS